MTRNKVKCNLSHSKCNLSKIITSVNLTSNSTDMAFYKTKQLLLGLGPMNHCLHKNSFLDMLHKCDCPKIKTVTDKIGGLFFQVSH